MAKPCDHPPTRFYSWTAADGTRLLRLRRDSTGRRMIPSCPVHHTLMTTRYVCLHCLGAAGGRATSERKREAARRNLAKANLKKAKGQLQCPNCGQPANESPPPGCPAHLV